MPISSRTVADGFNYDIVSRVVPKVDPATGQPTGEEQPIRVIVLTDGVSVVEVVFAEGDDWDGFAKRVAESKITIATRLPAPISIDEIVRSGRNGR